MFENEVTKGNIRDIKRFALIENDVRSVPTGNN
jgi:hypothetical protein